MFQASLPDPSDPKARSKEKHVQAVTSSVSAGTRSQRSGCRAGTTQQVPPSKPLASGGPSSLRRDGAGTNSFSDSLYFSFLNCKIFFDMHALLSFSFFLAAQSLYCCVWASLKLWCTGLSLLRRLSILTFPSNALVTGSRTCRLQQLQHEVSGVAALGLSCSTASGILLDQRSNLRPLHWPSRFSPTEPSGMSLFCISRCFDILGP